MQPFNCLIERKLHCSPVRCSPNHFFNAAKAKYPMTTTCLPFDPPKHVTIMDNEPKFPLNRRDVNLRSTRELDITQTLNCMRQQQRNTLERRNNQKNETKSRQNIISQKLKDFSKQNNMQTEIDSQEYLRIWFDNLALKEKFKLH